ncbi:hypothetical protein [Sphingomonas sp.]|jgi:hypothetical protein|uniref:hypothetical protein n=1 Tax=Sphingomonas sp. TaxID=28214 RepID=UPI00260512BC|nr:hypothetical protein [Sphingomonas sp.]MDF2494259.1 hypothetical protein [Sphingomonas sp.]
MKSPFLFATAALLALAACNSEPSAPEVLDSNPDPMARELANAGAIELPPSIKAEKSMRCDDNSLAYVTFFEGDKQVLLRTAKDGPATTLTAANGGEPLTAEGGWKLTGDTKNVTIEQPGKKPLSCHE